MWIRMWEVSSLKNIIFQQITKMVYKYLLPTLVIAHTSHLGIFGLSETWKIWHWRVLVVMWEPRVIIALVRYLSRSDFYPVNSRTPDMSRFQKMVEWDLTPLAHQVSDGSFPWHDNLSKHERLALRNLEEDKSIVVCNSDKGGLIVVINLDFYLNETAR